MLIINDEDKCKCQAYWQDNGHCSNGHPRGSDFELCTNPEKKCNQKAEKSHILLDKDNFDKEYPMCDECYETWIMG